MLPFINDAQARSNAIALIDDADGAAWTWQQLTDHGRCWRDATAGPKKLVFLYCRNRLHDVAALLGLVGAGHAVALLDPSLPGDARARLDARYMPDLTIEDATAPVPSFRPGVSAGGIHAENSILLSTSGSTGSPKFVRLSLAQIEHNAAGISTTLDIVAGEMGSAHLPLHYSYGLSVLTSHLRQGAPLLLSERGFMDGAFWKALVAAHVRHLPGVPYHYQMMQRLNVARLPLSGLRVMTQAGGAMAIETRQHFWSFMNDRGGRFHILYGQTEAAPRMTTLAHDDFPIAPGSVGVALPGGRIDILGDDGVPVRAGERGFVVYSGGNVMMGYAETRADLSLGNVNAGVLHTGDLGFLDDAGRLTLVGRANRIAKIVGLRVNLDDIEAGLADLDGEVAVTAGDDRLRIHYAASAPDEGRIESLRQHIRSITSLPIAALDFVRHDQLPRTTRGKIDRSSLS